MRTLGLNVLLFLVFATVAVSLPPGAALAAGPDFLSWALDRSGECDARWSLIADSGDAQSSPTDGTNVTTISWAPSDVKAMVPGALSHSVLTTRVFIHAMSKNERYLPLTARNRTGAAMGVSKLQSPAQAQLVVPYEVKRPLNSSIQQKNFFSDYGTSITRPRLKSFGWLSKDHRLFDGAIARPAYRSDRPRLL
jgi:hypothetical protein